METVLLPVICGAVFLARAANAAVAAAPAASVSRVEDLINSLPQAFAS